MTTKARRPARVRESVTIPGRVRKNMDMDAAKLLAAQEALGAKTETETVDRALDLVLGRARFEAAMDRITELGGIKRYERPR